MGKRLDEALRMRPFIWKGIQTLPDSEAVEIKTAYPDWFILQEYSEGAKVLWKDSLYKCVQAHTSQLGWEPDITPALWAVINETHAGTVSDPIPAVSGMEYEYGLYYLDPEDGNIYLCQRQGEAEGGKIVLYALPHNLVGNYFELYIPDDKGYSGLLEED